MGDFDSSADRVMVFQAGKGAMAVQAGQGAMVEQVGQGAIVEQRHGQTSCLWQKSY